MGIVREDTTLKIWARTGYPDRFPTPPRDSTPLSAVEAARHGFAFTAEESCENDIHIAPEELVDYLTTKTNVAAAVEQGRESYEAASTWLLEKVRPFFASTIATFVFSTRAWF